MNRWVAALASIGLVGVAIEPVVRAPDDDGFPLSTFPMFAMPRPTHIAMSYAQGVTRDGQRRALSPDHLDTGEVMQAFSRIQRAVAAGPRARRALCQAIAARVAEDTALRDVVEIRLVSGTYAAAATLAHGTDGRDAHDARELTQAHCDVPRSPR